MAFPVVNDKILAWQDAKGLRHREEGTVNDAMALASRLLGSELGWHARIDSCY